MRDKKTSRSRSSRARCTRGKPTGDYEYNMRKDGLEDPSDRVGTRTRDGGGRKRQDSSGIVVTCGATNNRAKIGEDVESR